MVALSRDRSLRSATSASVTVRVPAKINLHLGVGRRRGDGFHQIQTVFQAVDLWDEVTLTADDGLSLTVVGEGSGDVPVGDDNLATRAVRAVAALAGREPNVAIAITKAIPVAGGMGGGSADAAAALLAAELLFSAGLDAPTLDRLASGLGADIPFLLHGGTALGSGRGDVVSPVLSRGTYHWVLAIADQGLTTAEVYAGLDRQRGDRAKDWDDVSVVDGVLAAIRAGDVVALGRALHNDLQSAALALRPGLADVLAAGREAGAVGGVVSGSGPTVALLARDTDAAVALAASLAASGVCRTVRHATGPVPGARVL